MKVKYNLTEDKITPTLLKLSLPIIANNFIQTTYGMVDMIWVGKLGSNAVAAVGTASFFINLSLAIFTMISIGSGIKISHCIGAKKLEDAKEYIKNGFIMAIFLAFLYSIFVVIFRSKIIGFFQLGDAGIEKMAINFLVVSMIGVVFAYSNNLFSFIFNSMGNSKIPLKSNSVGFCVNMILDPILIFGLGNFKGLGVIGAAIATLIANILVSIIFYIRSKEYFKVFDIEIKVNKDKIKEVIKMGIPITIQRVTFIMISIFIAKIVVQWGANAIAVQKVGVQIESISYMTIGGLQGAIAAFVGQNFGANKLDRIKEGYFKGILITIIFGTVISIIFIIFPRELFSIFLREEDSLKLGADYMRILGFSQVFMCIELMTVGAFNGLGKTYFPPMVSIIFTALRIPMAIILSSKALYNLNGVWMSIALSSIIKGCILSLWFIILLKKLYRKNEESDFGGVLND